MAMPLLADVTSKIRKSGPNPVLSASANWWEEFSARASATRTRVTDADALSLTAFYRGVTLIASTLAALPLHIYEDVEGEGGKMVTQKVKTPETAYLWSRPNVEMSRQTCLEKSFANEVRGNCYWWIEQDGVGEPIGYWPIDRRRVRAGRTRSGMKVYEVQGDNGTEVMIDYKQGGEIVHIPNWGDGVSGYDPIDIAQQALALALSAEQYAAQSFATQVPPGIITTDQSLTEEQAEALVKRWKKQHAGIQRAQEIGFLGNGSKFQQLSVDHEKMQMEALRRFSVAEVARLLGGLPLHLLGDPDHASQGGGNGMEEQNLSLIRFTFQGHITRFEQAIDDNLLVRELTGRYCKFDLRGLMRGAMLQRYQAYAMGYGRWLTADDIRELEDMAAIGGAAADLFAQVNLVPVEQLGKVAGRE